MLFYKKALYFIVIFLLCKAKLVCQVTQLLNFNLPTSYLMPSEVGIHNNKWMLGSFINSKKIISNLPVRSYILSGDYQIIRGFQSLYIGVAMGEMSLVSSPYSENEFYATLAYHKIERKHTFDIAIQPGIIYRSMDTGSLLFPDQYDRNTGSFNPVFSSNEPFEFLDKAFNANFNFGASYGITIGKYYTKIIASYRNVNKPNVSFSVNPIFVPRQLIIQNKTNFHITAFDYVNVFAMLRSSSEKNELFIGGDLSHNLIKYKLLMNELTAGTYLVIRNNKYPNNVVFNVGLGIQKFTLGFAYSYNFIGNKGTKSDFNSFELVLLFKGLNNVSEQYKVPCEIY